MIPEISEFSYGFALTNELVGLSALRAAPVFPSLIEEGRAGGGYDVRLDRPGVPLYLQFKRAECMITGNAREIQSGAQLYTPFHRFELMEVSKSDQHNLLLQLDDGTNEVYYAAPRFHRTSEINDAWTANAVASRSIFVSPRSIGSLSTGLHRIAYDWRRTYLCSDPRLVDSFDGPSLVKHLAQRLGTEKQTLRTNLPAMIESIDAASEMIKDGNEDEVDGHARAAADLESRLPRDINPEARQLREISDKAARIFGAQLVIVQQADAPR